MSVAEVPEEEKRRRREGNQCVLGTHAMEGIFPDKETLEIMNRYAEGELTLDEFSEDMDQYAMNLLVAPGHALPAEWLARKRDGISDPS